MEVHAMLNLLFSFKGRISRQQYWLGLCLICALSAIAMFPTIAVASVAPPHILLWVILAAAFVATFLIIGVGSIAMAVKRSHDFGKPASWAFRPLSGFKLLFSEGEAHDNRYGIAPSTSVPGWPVFVGLVVVSLVVPCVVIYGVFFAGPTWKWPDCKPTVTAKGKSQDDAKVRWREAVATSYGRAYADSGITFMGWTACVGSSCTMSARPCVQMR